MMRKMALDESTQLSGHIRIGIIPTLAAYLVPRFLGNFLQLLPDLQVTIEESNTEVIIEQLKKGQLDLGILATPLSETYIEEHPLFYEEFFVYSPSPSKKSYLVAEELNPHELLLLEEGHCLRTQVVRLCQLKQQIEGQLTYQSSSLETLRRLVEQAQGLTVLPELMTLEFSSERRACLSQFQRPAPVREISLVHHKSFGRKKLRELLGKTILEGLPSHLQERDTFQLIEL
ncbi:MAG: LysR substrate-binding domain-containing protein [Bacteroidota bacterium]